MTDQARTDGNMGNEREGSAPGPEVRPNKKGLGSLIAQARHRGERLGGHPSPRTSSDGRLLLAMADALEDARHGEAQAPAPFSALVWAYRLGALWFFACAAVAFLWRVDVLAAVALSALGAAMCIPAELRAIAKRLAELVHELEPSEALEMVSGEMVSAGAGPAEQIVRLLEALVRTEDWGEKAIISLELAKRGVTMPRIDPEPPAQS